MAEGDFFTDEEKDKKQANNYITDYGVLISTYKSVVEKIDDALEKGMDTLSPIRSDLRGGGTNHPDDVGLIGELRAKMREKTGLMRTRFGTDIWQSLKLIEDLDSWNFRYSEHLEMLIQSLKFLVESSFAQINGLHNNIEEKKYRIRRLENTISRNVQIYNSRICRPPVQQEEPKPMKKELSEEAKAKLENIYDECETLTDLMHWMSPKAKGRVLNPDERTYLKVINERRHKFIKGEDNTNNIKEDIKDDNPKKVKMKMLFLSHYQKNQNLRKPHNS